MLALTGRTAEFERRLPYGALVDALDRHLRTLDETRLRGLDTEQPAGVRRARRAVGTVTGRRTLPRAQRRARAADAAGGDEPLVLTLDADPASIELLLACCGARRAGA
jgi:hypothetical protein